MKILAIVRITSALLLFVLQPVPCSAQSTPAVEDKYKHLFYNYADQRSLYEKALNSIGLTGHPIGRSYALIAGVNSVLQFVTGGSIPQTSGRRY